MERQTIQPYTTTMVTRTDSLVGGWRCVQVEPGAPCVMTPGITAMPLWSAASWDSHAMVNIANLHRLL